jgi:hypothetical protein
MVTRLDRLARSTCDLLNTLATITGKKAGFQSLVWCIENRVPNVVDCGSNGGPVGGSDHGSSKD